MTRVEHRAAADAVEIGDFDRRVGVVDRIVGIARTTVGTDVEIVELTRLPVASGAGILGRFHPVALLETEDVHLRLGQAPGHGRAGGPCADDQDVNEGGHAKWSRVKWVAAINGVRGELSTAYCCLLRVSAVTSGLAPSERRGVLHRYHFGSVADGWSSGSPFS